MSFWKLSLAVLVGFLVISLCEGKSRQKRDNEDSLAKMEVNIEQASDIEKVQQRRKKRNVEDDLEALDSEIPLIRVKRQDLAEGPVEVKRKKRSIKEGVKLESLTNEVADKFLGKGAKVNNKAKRRRRDTDVLKKVRQDMQLETGIPMEVK